MRDASYYRALPYRRTVEKRTDSDGTSYFIARISEIPPLRIHGESRVEALLKLDEIFDDVIESMIDAGEDIPEPTFSVENQSDSVASFEATLAAQGDLFMGQSFRNARKIRKSGFADVHVSQVSGSAVAGVR
ncbi:MAG: type II toxin-antitoxin system HicB family antitoxin [Gemmatimonadota bacterium]